MNLHRINLKLFLRNQIGTQKGYSIMAYLLLLQLGLKNKNHIPCAQNSLSYTNSFSTKVLLPRLGQKYCNQNIHLKVLLRINLLQ